MKKLVFTLLLITAVSQAMNVRLVGQGYLQIGTTGPTYVTYTGAVGLEPGEELINTQSASLYTTGEYPPTSATGILVVHTYYPAGPYPTPVPSYPGPSVYTINSPSVWTNPATGELTWGFIGYNNVYCSGYGCKYQPHTYYKIYAYYENVPTLISRGKAAFASSHEDSWLAAESAVDGDLTHNRWASRVGDDEWLVVDLGTVSDITAVTIRWETASAQDYDLKVSDDGRTWTTVAEFNDGAYGERVDTFEDLAVTGRYVKMQGITRASPWGYSIYEMEVVGIEGSETSIVKLTQPGLDISASSSQQIFVPQNAIDNYHDTRWGSVWDGNPNADNEYITIDLGAILNIDAVYLEWERAYGVDYDILTSWDDVNYQTAAQVRGADGDNDLITRLHAQGQYIRIQGVKRGTGYGYSLYNVEVYGTTEPIIP